MRKIALLMAVLMLFSTLTGCQKKLESEEKILVFADTEWFGTDAYQLSGVSYFHSLVIEPLLTKMPDGNYGPGLAKNFDISDDGKTITLEIPDDYKFSNGQPVTCNDIKRSIEWGLEISPFNTDYASINNIDIKGQQLIITLNEYAPSVLYTMASSYMPIISASQIDTMTAEELLWGALPYGAYELIEYVEGSHVNLKYNEYFKTNNPLVENKGKMNNEKVNIRFFNDDFAVMNSVVSGEIDLTFNYPFSMIDEIVKTPGMNYEWLKGESVFRLFLNNDFELFEDPMNRKAIIHLLDREEIAKQSDGILYPAFSFLSPSSLGYAYAADEYFKSKYDYDVELGNQILADNGWLDSNGDGYLDKDGKTFEFTMDNDDTSITRAVTEILQIKLKESGIKMNINNIDNFQHIDRLTDDLYQASLRGYGWGEASGTLPYIVNDSNILEDDAYFNVLYSAIANPDDVERIKGYAEAQKILMDTTFCIPLLTDNMLAVRSEKMNGAYIGDHGYFYINDVK